MHHGKFYSRPARSHSIIIIITDIYKSALSIKRTQRFTDIYNIYNTKYTNNYCI